MSALRARFPTVTVADVYEYPRIGDLARRLDEFEPTVVAEARVVAPTPVRAQLVQTVLALPLAALVGLRWLTWLLAADAVLVATTGAPVGARRARGLVVGGARVAGAHQPARAHGDHGARRADPAAWPDARPVPARRVRAPAALVHRVLGGRGGCREPVLRAVDRCSTRGRSARRSAATSTCTRCRRSPACSRSATGARSSRRSTCAGTGWTATCCGWGACGSTSARPSGRAARSRPAPASARGPRSRPGPRCSTPCRPASCGWGRPRCSTGRRGGTGRATRRPAAAAGWPRTARPPRRSRRCRWSPPRAGCWWSGSGCATRRRWSEAALDALRAVPLGAVTMVVVLAVVTLVSVRLLGLGFPRGVPRGAQPGGLAGVGDAAAHGRRAHHAVPALLEHGDAGVAAGARRGHRQGRRGVDRPHAARR